MKKVFEGKVGEDGFDRPEISVCFGEGWGKGLLNVRVRITVEDLPESKPEKNCGNCGAGHTGCKTEPGKTYCSAWQPKPAEPQGWEQRVESFLFHEGVCSDYPIDDGRIDRFRKFIRAEIERVREEEKNKILETLMETRIRQYDGLVHISRYAWNNVQENKHRGDGK